MTDNMNQSPQSPPATNMGKNHVRTLVIIGIVFAVHLWFFGVYAYGWVIQPFNVLESGEPLRTQVDFDLIPALPDALAESYDLTRAEQLAQLEGGQPNTISIDEAMAIVLEEGFQVREGDIVINETTEDDIIIGNDREPGDGIGVADGVADAEIE